MSTAPVPLPNPAETLRIVAGEIAALAVAYQSIINLQSAEYDDLSAETEQLRTEFEAYKAAHPAQTR